MDIVIILHVLNIEILVQQQNAETYFPANVVIYSNYAHIVKEKEKMVIDNDRFVEIVKI